MVKMVRPLEFGEPMVTVQIKLPLSLYKDMKDMGNISGYVRAVIISDMKARNKAYQTPEILKAKKEDLKVQEEQIKEQEQLLAVAHAAEVQEQKEVMDVRALYQRWEDLRSLHREDANATYVAVKVEECGGDGDKMQKWKSEDPRKYYITLIDRFNRWIADKASGDICKED